MINHVYFNEKINFIYYKKLFQINVIYIYHCKIIFLLLIVTIYLFLFVCVTHVLSVRNCKD
jgi:hypothetical protein